MKYTSTLPLSALIAVSVITLSVHFGWLPPGLEMLEWLQRKFDEQSYSLIMLIILLESIVYVGFYFPGQFFAVMLVILSKPQWHDIALLTVIMVCAATVGSVINFFLGKRFSAGKASQPEQGISIKSLILAMIHMNSLAFFMFNLGARNEKLRWVWIAGLLNLPYYLVLIAVTATMSNQIMQIAESSWLIFTLIGIWLAIALVIDIRQHRHQAKTS